MKQKIKKYLRDLPLQSKLTSTYLLAFFLPLIFISIFTINRMVSISNDKAQAVRQTQCNQIAANISSRLNEYYKNIYYISNNQILNKYFDYEYENTSSFFSIYSDINKQLLYFRIGNPNISDFTVYTDNPTFITNEDSIKRLTPSILEGYQANKTRQITPSDIVSGFYQKDGENFFSFSTLLSSYYNSKSQTLLSISYPEEDIFSFYQHESNDVQVFLVSPTEEIFSSTQREWIGKSALDSESIRTALANNYAENALTPVGKKLYYKTTFSSSPLLTGWNLYIEVSNETYFTEIYTLIAQTLLLITGIAFVGVLLFMLCSLSITRRLNSLVKTMSSIQSDDDLTMEINCSGSDEIGILARNFENMLHRIKTLILDVYSSNLQVKDLEIKHKQAELLALQSQINPHFLFNTMQSLSISSYNNDDYETAAYINQFCGFLRECLAWETKCVSLEKESIILENYLSLQKIRYEDKFEYYIDIPERFFKIPIPKFTLQPIVENSIEHGFEEKTSGGMITIKACEWEDMLLITIEDNGSGIATSNLDQLNYDLNAKSASPGSSNIGILNTNDRLRLFYGPQFGLRIESGLGIGTKVQIYISKEGEHTNV